MVEPAIVVDGVSKRFRLYSERNQSLKAAIMRGKRATYEEFWALKDVSFEIPRGSTFGLIGENGSGKSTMLKCITKILSPTSGTIVSQGSLAALLELGSGFHPELSGRENVYLNGSILGMRRAQLDAKFDEIVDFAGIRQFIDQPVKNYSSGMYVRLGFSIAINVNPDILLVDEVLAVGDSNFQDKCMEKFADFRRAGKTVVIVSHAMSSMRSMCDEVAWLEHGHLVSTGLASETVDSYTDSAHEERESLAGGGERWGSGEIRIDKVDLLGPDGQSTTQIHTGESMTIRLEYEAKERIERPVFGLALENVEGVYVWAHNSQQSGYQPDYAEGRGVVELSIPNLVLQPGTFDLLASAVDHTTTHVYDFLRHCLRFDVLTGDPREDGGIVVLGGKWSGTDAGRHPGVGRPAPGEVGAAMSARARSGKLS
ncbi:MAG TPA: ABC transporter ATP-binding protein [Jatrophihabitantaceae bacterium]|jgi:ABC-type polysaccharide/polyol phosphate transport system ATPase subunit|nr:ABC transporter ATP-binding protein [Jatrophihabitantaceae bacterium]